MTPFGIRKKLKALLGFGEPPKPATPPRPKYSVSFVLPNGDDYQVEAKEGDSLVLASGRGPYPISTGCSDGLCYMLCRGFRRSRSINTSGFSMKKRQRKQRCSRKFTFGLSNRDTW